jgi:hypothetical protein
MVDTAKLIEELDGIAVQLAAIAAEAKDDSIKGPTDALNSAAEGVGKSWSGSNLGYHARTYYQDYDAPPTDDMFSREWGLMFGGEGRGWEILTDEVVRSEILRRAQVADLQPLRDRAVDALDVFQEQKEAVSSILSNYLSTQEDAYLSDLRKKVDDTSVVSMRTLARSYVPSGAVMSRDSTAVDQGLMVAPHQQILAEVRGVLGPFNAARSLSSFAKNAADHLRRKPSDAPLTAVHQLGSRVFVGHGQSPQWRELKDFLQDRLGLKVDEFNRVPVAGTTTVARLSDMLNNAAFACLIMTAEDERSDGTKVARANVIHEVGLFQGRLGFERAIVLLEEGCEEFSNITGLSQLRYPAGRISAIFEDLRAVLEREDLL